MRRYITTIIALATAVACSEPLVEESFPVVTDEPEKTIYAKIGIESDSETKATYDNALHFYWQNGDAIKVIQGAATEKTYNFPSTGSKTFSYTSNNVLTIQTGAETASATFAGDITIKDDSNKRYFHFVYPASVTMSTSTTIPYGQSSVEKDYTTTTSCTYTIPVQQDGIWQPFLCGSTNGTISSSEINGQQGINLGISRNACFAVRVFENNGTTPKQVTKITISADNNFVGTLSGTTANNGSFADVTFTPSGTGNQIVAEGLENVAQLGGKYEYRFEVLPGTIDNMVIELENAEGGYIRRSVSGSVSFRANGRKGLNVSWDAADVAMEGATSWYEDYASNAATTLDKSTIYAYNIKPLGVSKSNITSKGIAVRKANTEDSYTIIAVADWNADNKTFNASTAVSEGGEYEVIPFVVYNDGGESHTINGAPKTVVCVPELSFVVKDIYSSYNYNGGVSTNNNIDGNTIYAKAKLNDEYTTNNLVSSTTLYYGGNTLSGNSIGNVFSATVSHGQYTNCYFVVTLANGYSISSSTNYTTNVTGIPYSQNLKHLDTNGWSLSNTRTSGNQSNNWLSLLPSESYAITPNTWFYIPEDISVTAVVEAHAYKSSGNYSPNIYVSATSSNTGTASGAATNLSSDIKCTDNTTSFTEVSRALIFTPAANRVCIYGNGKGSSGIGNYQIHLKSVTVRYR